MMMTGAVVMAVYKPNPQLVETQIGSLRAQTTTDWVCLLGIDGRDDATSELLHRLVDGDPRFEVHHFDDNVGVYRHFERLLALVPAQAEWVSLADQDDFWYPEKFSRMVPVLTEPGVMAVIAHARVVDTAGVSSGQTERRPGDVMSTLLRNQLTGSLAIVRREVVQAALPFPPDSDGAIHDHWLAVCAAALGRIVLVDSVVQDYVQHGGNVIGEVPLKTFRDVSREMREVGPLRYIDEFSSEAWAWRVSMAAELTNRRVADGQPAGVEALSRGRLSLPVARAVLADLGRRRLSLVAALGMLAASARWSRRRVPDAS